MFSKCLDFDGGFKSAKKQSRRGFSVESLLKHPPSLVQSARPSVPVPHVCRLRSGEPVCGLPIASGKCAQTMGLTIYGSANHLEPALATCKGLKSEHRPYLGPLYTLGGVVTNKRAEEVLEEPSEPSQGLQDDCM